MFAETPKIGTFINQSFFVKTLIDERSNTYALVSQKIAQSFWLSRISIAPRYLHNTQNSKRQSIITEIAWFDLDI